MGARPQLTTLTGMNNKPTGGQYPAIAVGDANYLKIKGIFRIKIPAMPLH
jgi:hypothetical protein